MAAHAREMHRTSQTPEEVRSQEAAPVIRHLENRARRGRGEFARTAQEILEEKDHAAAAEVRRRLEAEERAMLENNPLLRLEELREERRTAGTDRKRKAALDAEIKTYERLVADPVNREQIDIDRQHVELQLLEDTSDPMDFVLPWKWNSIVRNHQRRLELRSSIAAHEERMKTLKLKHGR